MSKQVWTRRVAPVLSATDGGVPLQGGALQAAPNESVKSIFPASGTIDKLTIDIQTAVAASATKTFTLNINGSDTALTGTINAGQTQVVCTGGPISVSAGDLVYVKYTHTGTPGSSSDMLISWLFNGSTSGESVYMGSNFALNTTTPRYFGVFAESPSGSTTTPNDVMTIASTAGNITKMIVGFIAAAGTTGSYRFTIYKNGVAQDGTSGTPDTRTTITCVATRSSATGTFSLPVVAGDQLYIQCDSLSSPSSKTGNLAIVFTATNAGESVLSWPLSTMPGGSSSVTFNGPHNGLGDGAAGWNSEANRQSICADKFKLSGLQVWEATAPGGVTSRTLINRKNQGNGTLTCTISASGTTGTDLVHQDNYSALDNICFFQSAVSGVPAGSLGSVSFIQFIQGGNSPGKGQQGNKKNAGGAVNISTPGGTQLMFTNLGVSSNSN